MRKNWDSISLIVINFSGCLLIAVGCYLLVIVISPANCTQQFLDIFPWLCALIFCSKIMLPSYFWTLHLWTLSHSKGYHRSSPPILVLFVSHQEMLVRDFKKFQNCQVFDKYIDAILFIKNIHNQAYCTFHIPGELYKQQHC